MNTLKIANTLIEAGLERKPAEAIAQTIDAKNQESVTKTDVTSLKKEIKRLDFMIVGLYVALGYIITLLHSAN